MPGNNIGYAVVLRRRGSHAHVVNIDFIRGASGTTQRAVVTRAGPVSSYRPLTLYAEANSEIQRGYPLTAKVGGTSPGHVFRFHWDAGELPAPHANNHGRQTVPFRYSIKTDGGQTHRFRSDFLYTVNIGSTGMIPFNAPEMPDVPSGDFPGSGTLNQISGILDTATERAQILYTVINSLSRQQLVTLILV